MLHASTEAYRASCPVETTRDRGPLQSRSNDGHHPVLRSKRLLLHVRSDCRGGCFPCGKSGADQHNTTIFRITLQLSMRCSEHVLIHTTKMSRFNSADVFSSGPCTRRHHYFEINIRHSGQAGSIWINCKITGQDVHVFF